MLNYAKTDFTKLNDLETFAQTEFFSFTFERLKEHHAMEAANCIEMRALDICHFARLVQDQIDRTDPDTETMWSLTRAIVAMAVAIQTPSDAMHQRIQFLEQELAKAAHRYPDKALQERIKFLEGQLAIHANPAPDEA
ncbi:MAG: hypothetical protein ACT6Q7_08475 [Blastomonas fulva]|uniref:hypothetical protein n=1 Tax=Blastomonas fulva TaxID=1550728 RepID=UPI0040342204